MGFDGRERELDSRNEQSYGPLLYRLDNERAVAVDGSAYMQTNRDRWNELVAIHERSAFYDVPGFKAGKSTLRPLEVQELGNVAGKALLHLQCHFGLDTLSWARRGARVMGVDYSEQAIALARSLGGELKLNADFLCANLYDLPQVLVGSFDIVFTSYGVLVWLPDLRRWAQVIAHFLKPGGTFYMAELHPFALVFDDRPDVRDWRIRYPYFATREPMKWQTEGTYADRSAKVEHNVSYEWTHSLSDVLNALIGAGLKIEFVHEFPFCICGILPFMEQGPDGWWRLKDQEQAIPFTFSVKATK